MPNPDEIDLETAERIKAHLDSLLFRKLGVTEAEATEAGCHCNNADCERCAKRVLEAAQEVACRHAEMYPAIADAMDAARYTDNPAAAIKKLEANMGAQIAQLVNALSDLKRTVAESTVPRDATPAHESAPKGAAGQ